MTQAGQVVAVSWEIRGAGLTAPALAGALELEVDNLVDFDDIGGRLTIDGNQLAYTSSEVDPDDEEGQLGTIQLADPLPIDAEEGEPVRPLAGQNVPVDFVAYVQLDEGDELEVIIPYAERPLWPEGIYDDPVAVEVSDDLETIVEVPGRTPTLDGAFIEDGTLPEPSAPTEPPLTSPTVTAYGVANGLVLRAEDVDPTTSIAYHIVADVARDADDVPIPFTPTPENRIGDPSHSTVIVVTTLPDGTPLELNHTYYLRAVASNVIGEAAPGPMSSGELDISNVSEFITAELIAGNITAGSWRVGNITADPENGIQIPQADGQGMTHFPADGSQATISGALRTNDITIDNNLTVNGELNTIAGTLGLASVVSAPRQAATVGFTYPSDPAIGADIWSLADTPDGTQWVSVHFPTNTVRRYWKSDGSYAGTLAGPFSAWTVRTVARLGNFYYLAAAGRSGAVQDRWHILKRRSSGAADIDWYVTPTSAVEYMPGVGTDGTNLLVSWTRTATNGRDVRVNTYTPNGDYVSAEYLTLPSKYYGGSASSVGRAPVGPNGEMRTWILSGTTPLVFNLNGTVDLEVYNAPSLKGLTWDGVQMVGVGYSTYTIYRFNPNRWPSSVKVEFSWHDSDPAGSGTHETQVGPPKTIAPSFWSWLTVTTPPPADNGNPDDPDSIRVYLDGQRQPDLPSGVRSASYASVTQSGIAPPTTNGFASATANPGVLRSDVSDIDGPLVDLRGSGAGRVGPYRWDSRGVAIVESVTIDAVSPFTGAVTFVKVGPLVVVAANVSRASGSSPSWTKVVQIPAGFRPAVEVLPAAAPFFNQTINFQFLARPDGELVLRMSDVRNTGMGLSATWIAVE